MLEKLLTGILGSKNDREINRIRPTVARINDIEEALRDEPEEKLRELTRQWQFTSIIGFSALHSIEIPHLHHLSFVALGEVG